MEDAYAAAEYVYRFAEDFNADKSKIAVGGDSAGGNLAVIVTHLAKDKGTPLLLINYCYIQAWGYQTYLLFP